MVERKLGQTVLDMLWRDIPNNVPCKVVIVALRDWTGTPQRVTKTGYSTDLYFELTDEYDVDELEKCRLHSLTYRPYTGVVEMTFLKPLYNHGD